MEREHLDVDVLFIGAGPACLSAALQLSKMISAHNREIDNGHKAGRRLDGTTLLVIEKGREIGSHTLSGAVVDPVSIRELTEGLPAVEPPFESEVKLEDLLLLGSKRSFSCPVIPPPLRNHNCYVASLGKLVRWLADLCLQQGVEVYPEFPAAELLVDGDKVVGARTRDRGRDAAGNPKPNFEPGIDIRAKVTVIGEGVRGTLAGQAIRRLGLDRGREPQVYALGLKELWRVPTGPEAGSVLHTVGFPLDGELGGGFVYCRPGGLVDLGLVVGLDYEDSMTDPHELFQRWKTHPVIRRLIECGEPVAYGAKAIPEGGLHAMPRLFADGVLLVGDSAGFLNSQRLKGIHLAIKSGMMAAETAFEALCRNEFSKEQLSSYQRRFEDSWAHQELFRVRNFRQAFQRGFAQGIVHSAFQFLSSGHGLRDPLPIQAGHVRMRKIDTQGKSPRPSREIPRFDGKLTFDRISDLFLSDTGHEEDQPCHLKILESAVCDERCGEEYGHPCQYFCPAAVYEIAQNAVSDKLKINFSNCIHCKTCEIMDPYQVILWTPPEGGGGPNWKNL